MPELLFGVLGALEVLVDGQPRNIPPGRRRAALTCLLVHAGQPVSADALIEAVWRDDLPQVPPKALRTILSRLRTVLGRDAIGWGPAGYRLTGAAVDAAEFEELVERAKTAEPQLAGEVLGRALALWRGPAYGEYADAPFATAAAHRLEQMRRDAVEARAAALIRAGEPGAAAVVLEEMLAEQPFREHALELLVTALYHGGRQAAALERLRSYRALLSAELGLDPSPDLVALEGRILGHALEPVRWDTSGVPAWLDISTAFVGREDELADLVTAVAGNRVTVVTGPGGVGKSRLAAEAIAGLHDRLGLTVAVIELAPVVPGRVTTTVADVLGLRPGTDSGTHSVLDDLVEYLSAVPHLLVLDNCEHVNGEVVPLVSVIAQRCRDVRVLVTSRRRLGLASELVLPLGPLRVPDPDTTVGSQGAAASVRLFGDRVRRLRPTFAVTADNIVEVAELCRRCDGLPLALELAASRTATSGVSGVLARLPTDVVKKSGGLSAVVAWSYQLLQPGQQALLDHLSVFAGDFSADAVVGLMAHVPGWSGDVDPVLAELIESSLVIHHETSSGSRYRLLEMVRAFAARRLEESGRRSEAGSAHGAWVRDVVAQIRHDWSRVDGAVVAARLTACSTEVESALRRALDAGELVLASEIAHAVARCLHWTPSLELRDLMIEVGERGAADPTPDVAAGLATAAFSIGERGDPARARALGTTALAVSQDANSAATAQLALAVAAMYAGDLADSGRWFRSLAAIPALTGEANASLALIACYSDELVAAREHAEIALAASPSGSDASCAFARYAAGEVEARTDPSRGAALLGEASAEADRVDAEQVGRVSRIALFALLVRGGRHDDAIVLGVALFAHLRRLGAWTQVWTLLRILAELLTEKGRWADAAFCLGAAQGAAAAPSPIGQDVERYLVLEATLSEHLGAHVLEQTRMVATATPRARVLTRAERALSELQGR
ncbi:Predicted ATPase [Blastococcus sp. DSM 46786]|uniref:BTAD domain-containing putative transcriptional regulator n=1 Tax=Blastococcus sp. DSM 46786 TaxID=1798227 RepID=UPI0008D0FA55|nr:BTAD domain-containing putative transcriptional regulator [Blastococcus sp. DSM 46786]SEK60530.1 Predicted ATPase [Blastococcus sp. DSM 46786]